MRKWKLASTGIAWVIATTTILFVAAYSFDLPKHVYLERYGQTVTGTVVSISSDNNRKGRCQYIVNGIPYNSEFFWGAGTEIPYVGKEVLFTYDPNNPSDHLGGNINAHLRGEVVGCIFFSLIPTFVLLGILFRKKGVRR